MGLSCMSVVERGRAPLYVGVYRTDLQKVSIGLVELCRIGNKQAVENTLP